MVITVYSGQEKKQFKPGDEKNVEFINLPAHGSFRRGLF